MMTDTEQAPFPIVDLTMEFLRSNPGGSERFVFVSQGPDAVAASLDALFAIPDGHRAALDDLMRFACALDLELMSPTAAGIIRTALISDPRVIATLGGKGEADPQQAWARTRLTGGGDVKQAPMFGIEAPQGTLKASTLIDPCTPQGPRARHKPRAPVAQEETQTAALKAPAARRRGGLVES